MKAKFVDCFMLLNTALSLNGGQKLPEMDRPLLQEVFTTYVNVSITLQDLFITDSSKMQIEMVALLNQWWQDPRLGANVQTRKLAVTGQIWNPKITPTKGTSGGCSQDITQFWRGFGEEGNVLLSEKIIINTHCTANFQKYPFDSQKCIFTFGTYRFPIEEVELKWRQYPVEIVISEDLLEFKLVNVSTYSVVEIRASGNFTILVLELTLQRHSIQHVIRNILPTLLLIILSYISLWTDSRNYWLRIILNLLVINFLFYSFFNSMCNFTSVSYLKSLDWYFIISVIFPIIVICESLYVGGFHIFKNCGDIDSLKRLPKNDKHGHYIEKTSRILFLVLYVTVMLFYYIFCVK